MRVVETTVFGAAIVMCLRRQMKISTRTVYCVNVVDGGGRRWRRCCMRPPVAVRSSPSLTCGSQNRMLETWQQRLPGSCWTGFPSPHRQPAPPFHLTPALRRYESHSNYQFTSSSSSICRYLATNRLCWAPLLSQSCLPSMHVRGFASLPLTLYAFLFILLLYAHLLLSLWEILHNVPLFTSHLIVCLGNAWQWRWSAN